MSPKAVPRLCWGSERHLACSLASWMTTKVPAPWRAIRATSAQLFQPSGFHSCPTGHSRRRPAARGAGAKCAGDVLGGAPRFERMLIGDMPRHQECGQQSGYRARESRRFSSSRISAASSYFSLAMASASCSCSVRPTRKCCRSDSRSSTSRCTSSSSSNSSSAS